MKNITLLIFTLLVGCVNTPSKDAILDSPVLGTLEGGSSDSATKAFASKAYRYNLLYLDTRSPNFNLAKINHAYSAATAFGENTKNSLILIAKINNIDEFHKISKQYHDLYIGEKYSYNDGPFVVAVKDNKMNFVVSLGGLSDRCVSRFFLDLEQAVNLEILDKQININIPAEAALCETIRIERQSDIANIIDFIKNVIKGKL